MAVPNSGPLSLTPKNSKFLVAAAVPLEDVDVAEVDEAVALAVPFAEKLALALAAVDNIIEALPTAASAAARIQLRRCMLERWYVHRIEWA